MRPDMKYVVIESGRVGGHGARKVRPRRPGEDMEAYPKQQGMRRMWSDHKEQTDLLGPLFGYIDKHVGKRWDDVWSDMCQHLDFRSVLGFHVKSHIGQHVEMHARLDEHGMPYAYYGWARLKVPPGDLYVHPLTGILTRVPGEKKSYRRSEKVDPNVIKVKPGFSLEREKGVWYAVTYTQREAWHADAYGRPTPYQVTTRNKRQLGKKELKEYRKEYALLA